LNGKNRHLRLARVSREIHEGRDFFSFMVHDLIHARLMTPRLTHAKKRELVFNRIQRVPGRLADDGRIDWGFEGTEEASFQFVF
jgi:hypothetical protein